MGKKLKSLSSLNVPGAGTYQPDYSPSKTQMPRFSMGMKLKPELNKLKVPGPGQYTNRGETLKTAAPSYGFGSSKRPDIGNNKHQQTPGPGGYKIPRALANVQDFAIAGRTDEQKFV